MNYAARNISNKLVWMTRQLRQINQASEIQEWAAAIRVLNELLVSVSDNDKLVSWNDLQSGWTTKNYATKTSSKQRSGEDDMVVEKESPPKGWSLHPKRVKRRVVMGKRKQLTNAKSKENLRTGDTKITKVKSCEMDLEELQGVEPSRIVEGEVEIACGVVENEIKEFVKEVNTVNELKESEVRELWRNELYCRLKAEGANCGVQWKWKTREWVTDRNLLERIAKTIQRDTEADIDYALRSYLDDEINRYLKTGAYDKRRCKVTT